MQKRFLARHTKSSAAIVSLAIHAILIIVAFSFVAVTVITKEDPDFEVKQVTRPRMPPKKIRVPVEVKKKPKPKLRKRLVANTVNRKVPDIKMPEITGVKGGLGSMGVGDGMDTLGFALPELNFFGTKAKGGNVFIILDSTPHMMVDELGGIPAYTIIKSELVRILETLDGTVVFNIAVYGGGGRTYARFPQPVPGSAENVAKVEEWLKPLNAVGANMGSKDYGTRTLGRGGISISEEMYAEPLKTPVNEWAKPTLLAMQQQADVVFILTCRWGLLRYTEIAAKEWSESKQKKWEDSIAKAKAMLDKENEQRRKKGQPPRVISSRLELVRVYLPGTPEPPRPTYRNYEPKEMAEALDNARKAKGSNIRKKDKYSINVIHFVRTDAETSEDKEKFKQLTSPTRGQYRAIEGLEAIKSYVE